MPRAAKKGLKNPHACGKPYSVKESQRRPHSDSATASDRPEVIVVDKIQLTPTPVFDTFFKWCAERSAIDRRKREGQPAPWTQDKILQGHKFTNVYPVCDKGSQFLIKHAIEKGSQEHEDVLFRVLLYQAFVRPSTFELLEKECSPLTWTNYSHEKFALVLNNAWKDGPIYTSAYQIFPARLDEQKSTIDCSLKQVEDFMDRGFLDDLHNAEYFGEIFERITSFPNYGAFMTFQLMIALSYTDIIHFHRDDWAIAGPGAVSGLKKMFGNSFEVNKNDIAFQLAIMRWIVKNAPAQFQRLGLQFDGLGPEHLPLSVIDVEHCLCETDKYARLAFPDIKGTSDRKDIKASYNASSGNGGETPGGSLTLGPVTMPKAWSNREREVPRICPREIVNSTTEYIVERIVGHRNNKKTGEVEYHIKWEGYSAKRHNSWEPTENVVVGAKRMLREYRKKKGLPAIKL